MPGDKRNNLKEVALVTSGSILAVFACSLCFGQQSSGQNDAAIMRDLAPELENAQLVEIEDLDPVQREQISKVDQIGFRFDGDFNSDGQQDLASVLDVTTGPTLNGQVQSTCMRRSRLLL